MHLKIERLEEEMDEMILHDDDFHLAHEEA